MTKRLCRVSGDKRKSEVVKQGSADIYDQISNRLIDLRTGLHDIKHELYEIILELNELMKSED